MYIASPVKMHFYLSLYLSYRDRTERPDPKDITFEDLEETVVGKLPGSLKGKAFVIRNCKSTRIYLFDFTAAVSVDDCENCELVIGPVKGRSVVVHVLVLSVSIASIRR